MKIIKIENLSQFYYINSLKTIEKWLNDVFNEWKWIYDLLYSINKFINDDIHEKYDVLIY